jgi:hypothetical protein
MVALAGIAHPFLLVILRWQMSVIVAVVTSRDGVVASDGRRLCSVHPERGERQTIESDSFDKTFVLSGGKIIGAYCGLLEFSGHTTSEHISEIVGASGITGARFESIVDEIAEKVSDRLSQVDEAEVALAHRKLNLLLVAGEHLTRSDLRIAPIEFHPGDRCVAVVKSKPIVPDQRVWYCIRGESNACAAAEKVFATNQAPFTHGSFLEDLVVRATRAGIRDAGPAPFGSDPACGGCLFRKRTRYE